MRLFKASLVISVIVVTALGIPLNSVLSEHGRTQMLDSRAAKRPSQDIFYTPPMGYEKHTPGAILKSRTIPDSITSRYSGVPVNLASVQQFLFRTTDALGNASAAVTTVLVPKQADPTKLLSYQYPYDVIDSDCVPSYTLQSGYLADPQSGAASPLMYLVIAALNKGWYINLPDHEGLKAAWTAGLIEGHTTLDSIRAILRSSSTTNVSTAAKVAMWGYSGGSIGSEWAAELQPSYAPELNLVGSAFGGIAPNRSNVLALGTIKTPFPGFLIGPMLGLAAAYPNMSSFLDAQLKPENASSFRRGLTDCLGNAKFPAGVVADYFKNPKTAISDPVPVSLFKWGSSFGLHGTPKIPLYVHQAIYDGLEPIADPDTYVANMCKAGAAIQYVRDSANKHPTEAIAGAAGAFSWLIDRLGGTPAPTTCTSANVAITTLAQSQATLYGSAIFSSLSAAYTSAGG